MSWQFTLGLSPFPSELTPPTSISTNPFSLIGEVVIDRLVYFLENIYLKSKIYMKSKVIEKTTNNVYINIT